MNPFFRQTGEAIAFDMIKAEHVKEATTRVVDDVKRMKVAIEQSTTDDKEKRLYLRDEMYDHLDGVLAPIFLLKETHPDAEMREACMCSVEALFNYHNELRLDEDLYVSLRDFSCTDLSPLEHRFVKKLMDSYKRNGFQLDEADRNKLKDLDDRLSQKELMFQKHISESDVALTFSEEELAGLPDDFKQSHRSDDGNYVVTTRYPDYNPVMKQATNEDVRKRLFLAYYNRASDTNLDLLSEIISLRVERMALLGFETYARYGLADVMAQNPERVWQFLKELREKVKEKAAADYQKLCSFAEAETVPLWSKFFVTNNYKEEFFQLDGEEVKCYLPLDRVLKGLFDVAQTLYGLRFEKEQGQPVWHTDVLPFVVYDQERMVGRFYLDLFPRENKYGHAACFGLRSGRDLGDSYQTPCAALVCNFSPPHADRPSLLTHDEVETLFHEFGHLMHQLLTTSPLSGFAGTSVVRDFVEMPSQIMEKWVWEKEALQRIGAHYQTGEPFPDELLDKMLAVKHLNSAIDLQQQIFYATIDMTYHDGFKPTSPEETTRIVLELQRENTLFPVAEGTHMQASFGHLIGYASAYYGYLWSRVYADDMFSVFKKNGVYDPATGKRFRDIILAKGDCEDPMVLIKRFLGREPRLDAFLENLGV